MIGKLNNTIEDYVIKFIILPEPRSSRMNAIIPLLDSNLRNGNQMQIMPPRFIFCLPPKSVLSCSMNPCLAVMNEF